MENDDLLDIDLGTNSGGIRYDILSVQKFVILSMGSLGLYPIWWIYKSWRLFKLKEGLDIWPIMRAIFAILFTYQLFDKILTFAKSKGYPAEYSSSGLFMGFLLINITNRLPGALSLISLFTFVCLIPPLKALNYAMINSEEYDAVETSGFNSRQIALLVIGGLLLLLVLFTTFFIPEEGY